MRGTVAKRIRKMAEVFTEENTPSKLMRNKKGMLVYPKGSYKQTYKEMKRNHA